MGGGENCRDSAWGQESSWGWPGPPRHWLTGIVPLSQVRWVPAVSLRSSYSLL